MRKKSRLVWSQPVLMMLLENQRFKVVLEIQPPVDPLGVLLASLNETGASKLRSLSSCGQEHICLFLYNTVFNSGHCIVTDTVGL